MCVLGVCSLFGVGGCLICKLSVLNPPFMFHLSRKELGKGDIIAANPRQSGSWGPLP